ncbi:DUF3885 domain-containing protein [Streptomyces sp. NBC_01220]|uniref:DUF3885 domain-containing protein n=1 Tax=Streptomyces sp. NBC_01220 TaxID=2903781 RepID=UPI003D80AD0C
MPPPTRWRGSSSPKPHATHHHPYDGGADVFLVAPGERNQMRDRHADWLHPSGL